MKKLIKTKDVESFKLKDEKPICHWCVADPSSPGYPGTDVEKNQRSGWYCRGCGEDIEGTK